MCLVLLQSINSYCVKNYFPLELDLTARECAPATFANHVELGMRSFFNIVLYSRGETTHRRIDLCLAPLDGRSGQPEANICINVF